LIQFVGVDHRYGSNILFEGFSWHIKPGTRTALVGPNGSGKTTLFKIATARIKPDAGEVITSKGTRLSLFQQIPDFDPEDSILDTALSENKLYSEYVQRIHRIHQDMDKVDHDSVEFERLLDEQAQAEDFAQAHDLHNLEIRAKKILTGLGFGSDGLERTVKSFSPGYQHRLGLAIALLNTHTLLLLDEPTNHLDDSAKSWLADYLVNQSAAYVLVTHDPEFLNKTTKSITEVNSKGVFEFEGSLEEFFEAKNEIQDRLQKQFDKEETYLKSRMDWVERFRAKATKARQAQSVLKRLEKRDKVESPEDSFWNQKPEYNFHYEEASKISFRITGGSFAYTGSTEPIYSSADMEVNNGDKVALVGPNGAGKSTFLRSIVGIRPFTTGDYMVGPRTKMGYFSQTHSEDLDPSKNLLETLLTQFPHLPDVEARSILGHFAFPGDSVFKSVGALSGGEQSRLRLALLVHSPTNCLLLDEPTNHLDIVVRDALKRALVAYKGSILVISHDPEFLTGLCDRTFRLAGGTLSNLNVSFDDYLSFHKEEDSSEISRVGDKKPTDSNSLDSNTTQGITKSARNQAKNRIKNLDKEILQIEKRLELLEKNKKDKEELLADPEFFKNRSYQSELDSYTGIKNEIAQLTENWESAHIELENLTLQVNS
jgi:ATP-binding cassette subfamily F protein 3